MDFTSLIFLLIKNWYWFVFPFLTLRIFSFLYLWWIRWEVWYKKLEWIMLEIIPPEENPKPFKAMEDLITLLWGMYDKANWRERWCEGELQKAPFWFSFELVSLGGKIHFYARIIKDFKETFTAAIHNHYPDAEIYEVEDYTQKVPKDIPNEEWEVRGEEYNIIKPDYLPIKTYQSFFEERPEAIEEEKRIDPIDSLLEAMAKLKENEQAWFQIVLAPVFERDVIFNWIKEGKSFVSDISKGGPKKKSSGLVKDVKDVIDFLITGQAPSQPQPQPAGEQRIRLTPSEINLITEIGRKTSKKGFKVILRFLHLYNRKKGPVPPAEHRRIVRGYLLHFATEDLNSIYQWGPTRVRIHYFFVKRRLYLRARRLFRYYCERLPLSFPWNMDGKQIFPPFYRKGLGRQPILNAEEIATIFHFPLKIYLPEVPRVQVKKRGLPPEIISGIGFEKEKPKS